MKDSGNAEKKSIEMSMMNVFRTNKRGKRSMMIFVEKKRLKSHMRQLKKIMH